VKSFHGSAEQRREELVSVLVESDVERGEAEAMASTIIENQPGPFYPTVVELLSTELSVAQAEQLLEEWGAYCEALHSYLVRALRVHLEREACRT
jgi:hypothetical protein